MIATLTDLKRMLRFIRATTVFIFLTKMKKQIVREKHRFSDLTHLTVFMRLEKRGPLLFPVKFAVRKRAQIQNVF